MNGTETKFNKSFLPFQPNVLRLMEINDKAASNYHRCEKLRGKEYLVARSQCAKRAFRWLLKVAMTFLQGGQHKPVSIRHADLGSEGCTHNAGNPHSPPARSPLGVCGGAGVFTVAQCTGRSGA